MELQVAMEKMTWPAEMSGMSPRSREPSGTFSAKKSRKSF
jgi:hypothetical protein